jgi:hypothetical protein
MELTGPRFGQIAVGRCTKARAFDCAGRIPLGFQARLDVREGQALNWTTWQCWVNTQSVSHRPRTSASTDLKEFTRVLASPTPTPNHVK